MSKYDYGQKFISNMTGLTGVESKHIATQLKRKGLDYTVFDWKTIGEDTRDFGKRSSSVKKKLGSMYGVSIDDPLRNVGHERSRYSDMEVASLMPSLMELHERRSKRSKIMDYSKGAKHTYKPTNKKGVKKWRKNPNRYDIIGIDNLIK